LFDKEKVEKQ